MPDRFRFSPFRLALLAGLFSLGLLLGGCGGGGGGGGDAGVTAGGASSEWDVMNWDEGQWG